MNVAASYELPASATRVAELLADQEFAQTAAGGPGQAETEVRHMEDGGFTMTLRRPVPVEDLPAALRAMARGSLELRQAMVWQPAAPDGARNATMAGEVVGAPAKMEGTLQLEPTAQGCRLSIDGQVKASIPLMGAAIEQAGANMVIQIISAQVAVLTERLTSSEQD